MVESHTTSITPATHADQHSVGGVDPLVNPLLLHASRHEAAGADEMAGLFATGADDAYTGTPGAGWTTIDISGTIGANKAIVFAYVRNTSGNVKTFGLRGIGDTQPTISLAVSPAKAFYVCVSDASGQIQIYGEAAVTAAVDVVGYIVTP